ncbi:MAG: hypothetical protein IBJ15_00985 [Alphaproteobacteria bacterium]|nr:hypothetical protein [Alphaproteobacteria bacterium]
MIAGAVQLVGKRRWSKERRDLLALLWPDPEIRTEEIAARLGVSVTAARGQAARLGLRQISDRFGPRAAKGKLVLRPRRFGASACPAPALVESAPVSARPEARCCAPLWDDGTPASERRYCDGPVSGRSFYCEAHRATLIVTPRRKRRTAP